MKTRDAKNNLRAMEHFFASLKHLRPILEVLDDVEGKEDEARTKVEACDATIADANDRCITAEEKLAAAESDSADALIVLSAEYDQRRSILEHDFRKEESREQGALDELRELIQLEKVKLSDLSIEYTSSKDVKQTLLDKLDAEIESSRETLRPLMG